MIFDRTVHEEAVREVAAALRDESRPDDMAETLTAVAEDFDVPIEEVIRWIHRLQHGAELRLSEFVATAREYAVARAADPMKTYIPQP